LSLGAIDGRNVWRADLQRLLPALEGARDRVGPEHLWLAPSCSLLHVPIDLSLEKKLDPEIRGWLAYAKQKLEEVVALRRALNDGALSREEYERFLEEQIDKTIQLQDQLGLDVPVQGEFERNDMVEYFGEQLRGFAFTEHGWVQSYGSRYVKPPIIYGDVARP